MSCAKLATARSQWPGREVVVVDESDLAALGSQGVPVRRVDGKAMALAGLAAAREELA